MIYDLRFTNKKLFYAKIKNSHKSNFGFTLIELLVVIVIIGALATLLLANFIGVRQRSRDAQRKGDLRQMQSAIELYKADQNVYPPINLPPNSTWLNTSGCPSSSSLTGGAVTYMAKIPCDPSGASWYNSGNYFYSLSGNTYILRACIENSSDTDQNVVTIASGCSSGKGFELTNP